MATKGNDPKLQLGHRQRLREKFEQGITTDIELLEILLGFAIPRRDMHTLAKTLNCRFGGIYQTLCMPIEELQKVNGLGASAALLIKVVHALKDIAFKQQLSEESSLKDKQVLYEFCRNKLTGRPVEEIHIFFMDKYHRLITTECHAVGTFDCVNAYTREIAKRALAHDAVKVVMAHNHPNTTDGFSPADKILTKAMFDALYTVEVDLVDHLVVARGVVHSLAETNFFNPLKFEKLKEANDIANNAQGL